MECLLFRFSKGDRELEVRTATYGPVIDQSQYAKSVSHVIKYATAVNAVFIAAIKNLLLVIQVLVLFMPLS